MTPHQASVTVSGGFHNASGITLRVTGNRLSVGQYKRLDRHMCGIKGCVCGWRGYELEGMSRSEFGELTMDAAYRAYEHLA